jgi:outer membrane protein assembly factor BamA
MKKILAVLAAAVLCFGAFAQEEEKEMKTGWSFGVLPTATYSVDNGFQAGAFGDVYYYGDGGTYPDPLHKISWEGSYFTHSHRMRLYLAYDSKYLIPNMRVNASVTYMNDPLYSIWGFNGAAATQNYDVWGNRDMYAPGTTDNVNYYGMSREMLRILANFQGRITDNLNWAAGMNFWKWNLGAMKDNGVDVNGNKQFYNTTATLYNFLSNSGVLTDAEKNGGISLELNAGLVYDTRDMEAAPNKGIWAEAYLNGNFIGTPYLKACMYFRHYISIPIPIPAGNPVFAYRLALQHTIAGETPLYMVQNNPLLVQRNMISEGFGSSNTIRGLRENRILADGMAWANTELRIKLVKFTLANQYFYIAVNPFFDAGIITKPYKADAMSKIAAPDGKVYDPVFNALTGTTDPIYDPAKIKTLIYSGGAGLKIAMNQNFIVSADFAKCFTPGMDAGLWIGIGINYQF